MQGHTQGATVTRSPAAAGVFRSGLPYNRLGRGPRIVVVFQGLMFENRPLSRLEAPFVIGIHGLPEDEFTTFVVTRRRGLPPGVSLADMSDDYAAMIQEEFGGPVDVVGISTGGSIALYFGADHPDLVRRLVIHSAAHSLSGPAKKAMLEVADRARRDRWREAWAVLLGFMRPHAPLDRAIVWLSSLLMSLSAPEDPSDLVRTVEAEDRLDFRNRLPEITAPTLAVAGDQDPFYTEALIRETAAGIPNARLILYQGMGHPAAGKRFRRDLLAFLTGEPWTPGGRT